MRALLMLLAPLQFINDHVLRVGRWIAVAAITLMVCFILAQVFFRYVLNNALPWPDEAARFMMLWMTGLVAPTAYRRGGFVAIDTFQQMLNTRMVHIVALILLGLSLMVLIVGVQLGYDNIGGLACNFKSATLWLPFTFEFALPLPFTDLSLTLCTKADAAFNLTFGWTKMPKALIFASLYVGLILLTLVNIELILRSLIAALGGQDRLPAFRDVEMAGAE